MAALAITVTGCRQDMQDQPKFLPQRGTSFFADGRSARTEVPGTVARSQGNTDSYFVTGLIDGKEGDDMPFPATPVLLARGQERYNIYCSPCHSRVGNGEGMIVQRGYYQSANFHTERLRQAPLGHFVSVMLNGYGAMPTYGSELPPADRWAVAAYIRALQLSQHAKPADAPKEATFAPLKQIAVQQGLSEALLKNQWGIQAAHAPSAIAAAAQQIKPEASSQTVQSKTVLPSLSGENKSTASTRSNKPVTRQTGPPANSAPAGDAIAGKQVYAADCQICHQASRAGNPPIMPSLLDIISRVGQEHVRDVVTNGVPGGRPPMPAFGDRLSQTEIDNLIAYLHSAK
jgi:mono/diheme cytochrome c family protein